ncbi:MAG: trigger factor [Clostridiales bacterium]|nr:trigger factor [Clostridiales bacterium]MBR5974117.1 trigger factor [Clostridiales bacterium]
MSSVEKKENNIVVISLEASQEEFKDALMKAYNKNKNRFQIPGFRKGKAPYKLVKQYYGEGVFYDDAIDYVVNPAYQAAVKEHNLEVVSRPELDIQEIGEEKGMKYTVTVTVKPEVELGQYEGVEAEYRYVAPSDETVEAELKRQQERNGRMVPVEGRAVEDGDTVTIDYEGFVDGVAFEGGKAEGHDLKIGSNSFIPGFEEQLIGHNIDEEFPITVTFPEDYHAENLKGKEATFQIKIHDIKVKELPEIDDDFVKDVSEFDTLEEYKADIMKKQTEQAEKSAQDRFENEVVKVVTENAKVDVPDCMVDTEIDSMIDEQSYRMRSQGIELEMYLKYMGQTMEEYREGLRTMAAQRVKTSLVLEAVGKAMGIEATDADVEEEAEKVAAQYGMKKEDFLERIKDNDKFIRDSIVGRKTVDALAEKAIKTEPKEEPKTEEAPAEEASEEKTEE